MKALLCLLIIFGGSSSWAALNTIFIGDSHSYGKFGTEIDSFLRTVSKNVTTMASCGSSPSTWMAQGNNYKSTNCGYWSKDLKGQETRVKEHKVDSFPGEIDKLRPDLVVIALGTNVLGSSANIKNEEKSIQAMLDAIKKSGSECIWIGPPDAGNKIIKANLQEGVNVIKGLVEKGGCGFIDSTQFTKYPTGQSDGIHYGPKDSEAWGKSVVGEMKKLPQIVRARAKEDALTTRIKGEPATDFDGVR